MESKKIYVATLINANVATWEGSFSNFTSIIWRRWAVGKLITDEVGVWWDWKSDKMWKWSFKDVQNQLQNHLYTRHTVGLEENKWWSTSFFKFVLHCIFVKLLQVQYIVSLTLSVANQYVMMSETSVYIYAC